MTGGEQALFNLEIKNKSGSILNPDIHHSKVPSSGLRISHSKVFSSGMFSYDNTLNITRTLKKVSFSKFNLMIFLN